MINKHNALDNKETRDDEAVMNNSQSSIIEQKELIQQTTTSSLQRATSQGGGRGHQRLRVSLFLQCLNYTLRIVIVGLSFLLVRIVIDVSDSYGGGGGLLSNTNNSQNSTMTNNSLKSTILNSLNKPEWTLETHIPTLPKEHWYSPPGDIVIKKILYIVTSSSPTNPPRRGMQLHPQDRLASVVIPVVKESLESMIEAGFHVDLYLVLAYNLTDSQREEFASHLPPSTQMSVWQDAFPMDYDKKGITTIMEVRRSLSRQHRYVVRDKLFDYDFFCAFEDDMKITGTHVHHYLDWTRNIEKWRKVAPDEVIDEKEFKATFGYPQTELWFGLLTKKQLARMRMGFIRVETLLEEKDFQEEIERIEVDLNFSTSHQTNSSKHQDLQELDPSLCCHVKYIGLNGKTAPREPNSSSLMMWEAGIAGMGVRLMPDNKTWVGVMNGPRKFLGDNFDYKVGKYHAVSGHDLKDRPVGSNPKFLSQSAGWMMTRNQILETHDGICAGSFLPPFNDPIHPRDGLWRHNVEYWSGGLQLWCPMNGCNIQRILSLDPHNMSKHLLYHTANNKQRQIKQERRVRANDLLGQLNHLKKDADDSMQKILTQDREEDKKLSRRQRRRQRRKQEEH